MRSMYIHVLGSEWEGMTLSVCAKRSLVSYTCSFACMPVCAFVAHLYVHICACAHLY